MLKTMFEAISGTSPYQSPTDMGVNMAGYCIVDDEVVCQASREEILRRFYAEECRHRRGRSDGTAVYKIELLMKQLGLTPLSRAVVSPALAVADRTGDPAAAMEMPDGTILTGKTSELLGCSSALLLNALKYLGGIPDEVQLISPSVIEPVQDLKVNVLGNKNPRLHIDELLVALSICAVTDPNARRAVAAAAEAPWVRGPHHRHPLRGDEDSFRRLGVRLTSEPSTRPPNSTTAEPCDIFRKEFPPCLTRPTSRALRPPAEPLRHPEGHQPPAPGV